MPFFPIKNKGRQNVQLGIANDKSGLLVIFTRELAVVVNTK